MSRIEMPTTHDHMQDLIDRYGATTVTVGLNQIRTQRLDAFASEFLADDCEPIIFDVDGKEELYSQRLTSGVTLGGMMIHTRLHRLPHTVDIAKQYILVVDSLYDTEPEQYWFAGSEERVFPGAAAYQTDITASSFAGYGYGKLRLVDTEVKKSDGETDEDYQEDVSVVEDDEPKAPTTEELLESALVRLGLPKLSIGDGGWRFRVGPGMYDDVIRMQDVQDNVAKMREELTVAKATATVGVSDSALAPTGSDQ